MDHKRAQKTVFTKPNNQGREDGTAEVKYTKHHSWSGGTNRKEDAMVDAIDQRRTMAKYADLIDRMHRGEATVEDFLSKMSPAAVVALQHIAENGESEKNRLDALKDILDRAGYSPVKKNAHMISADPTNAPKDELRSLVEGLIKKTKVIEVVDDDYET